MFPMPSVTGLQVTFVFLFMLLPFFQTFYKAHVLLLQLVKSMSFIKNKPNTDL